MDAVGGVAVEAVIVLGVTGGAAQCGVVVPGQAGITLDHQAGSVVVAGLAAVLAQDAVAAPAAPARFLVVIARPAGLALGRGVAGRAFVGAVYAGLGGRLQDVACGAVKAGEGVVAGEAVGAAWGAHAEQGVVADFALAAITGHIADQAL